MKKNDYTKNDYYSASLNRLGDLEHLRMNQKSIILSLYCAGVSVECMFRAYILKETNSFDDKHDLFKLYNTSKMGMELSVDRRMELTSQVKKISEFWFNNLRYTSDVRLKRKIAHKFVRTSFKDINKYLDKHNNDIFDATYKIIETGKELWT